MLLFGYHMPKCAGTTLLFRAMSELPFNQTYQSTNIPRNFRENRMEFAHFNTYEKLRFVFGHSTDEEMLKLIKGPVRLFTGLRDPHERLKSHLVFMRTLRRRQGLPPMDMDREIAMRSNAMCSMLIAHFPTLAGQGTQSERALRVLDHFWCVYFSERFEETSAPIYEALKIRPEKSDRNRAESTDEEEVDVSQADLGEDVILYNAALERFTAPRSISSEAERFLAEFRALPSSNLKIRRDNYRTARRLFREAGMLNEVIAQRRRMLAELEMELEIYEQKAAGSGESKE